MHWLHDVPVKPTLQLHEPEPLTPSLQLPWLLQGVEAPPGQSRHDGPYVPAEQYLVQPVAPQMTGSGLKPEIVVTPAGPAGSPLRLAADELEPQMTRSGVDALTVAAPDL